MGITTIRILGTLGPGRIGMVSWFRWCSAHGKVELFVLFFGLFFDLAFIWISLALYWICYIMFSVVIVRGMITRITCFKIQFVEF